MTFPKVKYYFDDNKNLIIENYQWAKPFSNYFPGIAGKFGIPMWAYYINRGQCLSSLGVKNKDGQILEFESFNKAVQSVSHQVFQTFLLIDSKLYIPFIKTDNHSILQKLTVKSHEIELNEYNPELGLKTSISYFPIVNYFLPVFARRVTVTLAKKNQNLSVIDGTSRIIPYGTDRHCTQNIPRHIEGMCKVDFINNVPVFRLKQAHNDIEEIKPVSGGNFYLTIVETNNSVKKYIVDPKIIFADSSNYDFPWNLKNTNILNLLKQKQITHNKTPCAFSLISKNNTSETISFTSLLGNFTDKNDFDKLLNSISDDFIKNKKQENKSLIKCIKKHAATLSSNKIFDEYIEQTFLENVMRGGIPINLSKTKNKAIPFYIFARQNGDLERDYHKLLLEPTFYSQGEGHYRSINQNRRCDSSFFPFIHDFNIKFYLSLIQLDGNNPLEITPVTFSVKKDKQLNEYLKALFDEPAVKTIKSAVHGCFTPGYFAMLLYKLLNNNFTESEKVLSEILKYCSQNKAAESVEGYWIDHWSYNLDLIENYIMIYPDKLKDLIFDNYTYSFYDSSRIVLPRKFKYFETERGVRQYNSTKIDQDKEKFINARKNKNTVHTEFGNGSQYFTNLFEVLTVLFVNRISNLDPFINGLEMDSNKPGWNDSLNGLPGLIGSSLGQAFELERLCINLINWLEKYKNNESIQLFIELYDFITKLNMLIKKRIIDDNKISRIEFWDKSHVLKENYREITKLGISGKQISVIASELISFFKNCKELLNEKYSRKYEILNSSSIPYMYYINEITEYEVINNYIIPKAFKQKQLPLFLEGAVHYIKVNGDYNKTIYTAVKKSKLYDKKIKMYKVCESLKKAGYEIGRVHAWGPGWIENESIYTHMEYKYLLELLKCGHYEDFFNDIKTMLMPFLKPEVYGRNTTENVSFIISSAFDDESMHGQGLQPRLSGVTAEMLNIWQYMTTGTNPFFIDNNEELCFQLRPIIESSFFTQNPQIFKVNIGNNKFEITVTKNSFAFMMFSKIPVIYKNPKRLNTYNKGVKISSYKLTYNNENIKTINSDILISDTANDIRNFKIKQIEATIS